MGFQEGRANSPRALRKSIFLTRDRRSRDRRVVVHQHADRSLCSVDQLEENSEAGVAAFDQLQAVAGDLGPDSWSC